MNLQGCSMNEESAATEKAVVAQKRRFHVDRVPFLPQILAGLIRLLHRSCQFTILGKEYEDLLLKRQGPALTACWHFAFPAVIYYFRDRGGMVMVSRSRDGEWAASVVKLLGYEVFRGSPGKGGATALRKIIAQLQNGPGCGLIADGSQGPALKAQKGILLLARYSGAPLIPFSMAADHCWRFRSWDRTLLVKPFSRVVFAFGPPIDVARDASAEEMEQKRVELENSLNALTLKAEEALHRKKA